MLPNLITAKEVKEYLHIGDETLYNLLRSKSFPSFKVNNGEYKIIEDDFKEWMKTKCKKQTNHFQVK